jgi:hypothetical protein
MLYASSKSCILLLPPMSWSQNNVSLNSREPACGKGRGEKTGRIGYQQPENYRLTAFPAKTGFYMPRQLPKLHFQPTSLKTHSYSY